MRRWPVTYPDSGGGLEEMLGIFYISHVSSIRVWKEIHSCRCAAIVAGCLPACLPAYYKDTG